MTKPADDYRCLLVPGARELTELNDGFNVTGTQPAHHPAEGGGSWSLSFVKLCRRHLSLHHSPVLSRYSPVNVGLNKLRDLPCRSFNSVNADIRQIPQIQTRP